MAATTELAKRPAPPARVAQKAPAPEKKKDWITPVAIGLGVVGLGTGLFLYFKGKSKGTWILLATSSTAIFLPGESAGVWLLLGTQNTQITALPTVGQWLLLGQVETSITIPASSGTWALLGQMQVAITAAGPWLLLGQAQAVLTAAVPTQYTLGVVIDPPGYGYVIVSPGKNLYNPGDMVTLTPTPYIPHNFLYWTVVHLNPLPGETHFNDYSPVLSLSMSDSLVVIAEFEE